LVEEALLQLKDLVIRERGARFPLLLWLRRRFEQVDALCGVKEGEKNE
jgi:hypothetical protein